MGQYMSLQVLTTKLDGKYSIKPVCSPQSKKNISFFGICFVFGMHLSPNYFNILQSILMYAPILILISKKIVC